VNPRLAAFAGLYGGYVLFLHLVDGPWRHWKRGREGRAVVDPWTATHVVWGAIGQRFGLSAKEVMILGAVNEALEFEVRRSRPDLLWGEPESPANVIVDMAATWAGFELARALGGGSKA